MTTERIKEIQQKTAYPDNRSVQQALLQVYNECSQFHQQEISDDEIFKGIIEHCKIQHNRISSEINAMIEGAKWYREQLKSKF